ncbi:Pre-mRNA splicing factor PRP21 like protein-domain-containing protein [Suillus subalutaceus]|uniref:Pre-mRNA splicing factor PRP21 like protein-domain-containing protein n=1 Tax=Suillus subalutaceus TaxID=48586 RepID=UPI001B87A0B0|nr:Pre-mRNA splicing factor PRP21 like protein-domain-containing protein [Suillus subalutaceus]KAG1877602.1 Pre-mRNA splicing factor PRP21 like protein-domain-containing protein [Suillus subalutaceus]
MAVETQMMPVMNGHAFNGDVEMENGIRDPSLRFTSGLILPPPEIKSVIDRTALFVARSANPPQFEDKIRENQRQDPKFSFLNPADPYHAYYRHRMEKIEAGEELDDTFTRKGNGGRGRRSANDSRGSRRSNHPQPQFAMDMPNVSPIDLDIMKLTALFTARRGRTFLATLSQNEGRNYQFDFLRPTHSLFGCFNRLVEQYLKILYPGKEMLAELSIRAQEGAKGATLEQSRKYARWERLKREKDKKRQDDQEAEKRAFAEIDWHDYAIVQTIDFTVADANSELPPPMSVQEVESMTLAQKRMAAMIMENTADEIEAHKARQAAAEAEAAAAVSGVGIGAVEDEDAAMEQSDDEDDEAQLRRKSEDEERVRELERARAMQASASISGPMKIRTDYVPKLGAKKGAALTTCTICGQQIPVDELDEHMRIELLDPKWKSHRDNIEARKAQASELLRGANVVSSLKNLARTRVDIFGAEADEERRKKEEEEEKERRKEREKVVWDGHTATKVSTMDKYSTNVNFDEQIAAIHRAKGLGPQDANAIGPGIGPVSGTSACNDGSTSSSRIITCPSCAIIRPASAYPPQAPPVMLPPLHYQGLDSAQPFGYQPPVAGMHPSRMAGMMAGGVGTPPHAGMVRSADEMEGLEEQPAIKRQKIAKLPGGALYPEADWVAMHPYTISLSVQLPNDPSKPEWKLNGQTVTVTDLPLTLLVSTLRDRINQVLGSNLPLSKVRISYAGKMLTNNSTIASHNLEEDDLVVLSITAGKKK